MRSKGISLLPLFPTNNSEAMFSAVSTYKPQWSKAKKLPEGWGIQKKPPIKLWLGLIMVQDIRQRSELIRTGTDGVWKNINGSRYNLKTRTFFQRIIVQPIHISSEVKKHSFRIECEIPRTICRIEITSVPVNLTKIWELQQQKHF